MEAQGLRVLLPELMNLNSIVGYVHDNDSKMRKIIRESGWGITEYLDPGHSMKSFEKKIQNFNRKNGNVLNEIEGQLKRWMKVCIRHHDESNARADLWNNCVDHFCGNHEKCFYAHKPTPVWSRAGDPASVELLKKFVQDTSSIVTIVFAEYITQSNESFHRLKIKYANKDYNWRSSWDARMMCAVLDRNLPNWKLILYQRMQFPQLSPENLSLLMAQEQERLKYQAWVRTDEGRAAQMKIRKMLKGLDKKATGDEKNYEYKSNPFQTGVQ